MTTRPNPITVGVLYQDAPDATVDMLSIIRRITPKRQHKTRRTKGR